MGIKGKPTAENRKIQIAFNHFEIKRLDHTFFFLVQKGTDTAGSQIQNITHKKVRIDIIN